MDYVDFIVHVVSREKRAFYGLERLRKSATTISVAALNAELKAAIAATRAKNPKKTAAKTPTKVVPKKIAAKTKPPKKTAAKKSTAVKPASSKGAPRKTNK
jgi:ribosome-associated protein